MENELNTPPTGRTKHCHRTKKKCSFCLLLKSFHMQKTKHVLSRTHETLPEIYNRPLHNFNCTYAFVILSSTVCSRDLSGPRNGIFYLLQMFTSICLLFPQRPSLPMKTSRGWPLDQEMHRANNLARWHCMEISKQTFTGFYFHTWQHSLAFGSPPAQLLMGGQLHIQWCEDHVDIKQLKQKYSMQE